MSQRLRINRLRARSPVLADIALAALVCWAASSIYFSHPALLAHYGISLPHSSDNVAPYLLFDDLFRRHLPWAGWQFPEAPFWFPDVALAWLVYAVLGSLNAAIAAYAWVSSSAFVLLVRAVVLRSGGSRDAWRIWLALWLVSCVLGAWSAPGWFSHLYGYVFLPYIHSGNLLAVLAGLALLLDPPARRGWPRLAVLALLCGLALASDRLFELQFMLPALALCGVAALRRRTRWHGLAALLLALILVGCEGLRRFAATPFATDAGDRIGAMTSLAGFARDLRLLFVNDPFNSLMIGAGLCTAIALSIGAVRGAGHRAGFGNAWGLLAFFLVPAALVPLAASLALGRYHTVEEWRYLQTFALLPLPLVVLAGARVGERAGRIAAAAVAAAAILTLATLGSDRRAGLGYAADQEACLRDAARRQGLQFGVATYWHAGAMTARFAHGPVVAPLGGDLGPRMRTIVDLGWLGAFAERASGLPTLQFVDETGYTREQLDRVFGPSATRLDCPRSSYRLYRARDGALAHWFRAADWLPSQLLQRLGRAVVPAAAWAADADFAAGDGVHVQRRFAVATPVLRTALDVPPGRVEVWLDYRYVPRAPGAGVRWEVHALDEAGFPRARLGFGTLERADAAHRVDLPLAPPAVDNRVLGIVIAAEGDVDLQIAAVGLAMARF